MTTSSLPKPSPLASRFAIDPSVVYLNHGSFGACPIGVIRAQQGHRDRVEADAMRFYIQDLWGDIDRSRAALAGLINARPSDLVFLPNATSAVATVIANTPLEPGDEVLISNFEYPACVNNLRRACDQAGAKLVVAELPWDDISEDSVLESFLQKSSERTRLAMFSLITSATAIRLPVQRLIARLKARGIETLLDAAHGPGCVPMDLEAWGATYTTGNGHKWLCAPKGAAFLHVAQPKQSGFRPLVLSNDAFDLEPAIKRTGRSAFNHEFDYMGTDDRSAILSLADAIECLGSMLPGGIDRLMEHNRDLCINARDLLCERLGTAPLVPDSMLGPLATIDIPTQRYTPTQLRIALMERFRIEAMIVPNPLRQNPMVRVSPQVYNSLEQYEYLADSISGLIG